MKCSHGVPFEVKCRGCFEDAMKRVSASQPEPFKLHDYGPRGKPDTEKVFVLGDIQIGIDTNPRPL